jgi:hypothetical protein
MANTPASDTKGGKKSTPQKDVRNYEACMDICSGNSTCNAFNYNTTSKVCDMLSATSLEFRAGDDVIGGTYIAGACKKGEQGVKKVNEKKGEGKRWEAGAMGMGRLFG